MRLQTPEKIRTLQRKLYLKAKAEPDFRFYLLYDKVYREDILFHAYRLARSNKGAPGVDGQSFEEMGLEGWLSGIRDDLRAKTYRPEPVRRAMVPKPGGGERPLGIPTIRDRVVQGAVKLVIEPIFEADLEPSAYGYRPKRSAGDAVQAVHKLLCRGYGTHLPAYRAVDNYVYERVRHFLVRRHKVPSRGTTRFSAGTVFGDLGVLRLRRVHLGPPPCASG